MRQSEDNERMDTYNRHLWLLAISMLSDKIQDLDCAKHMFRLTTTIKEDIPAGTYILNKDSNQYIQLRYGHPLGRYIVETALKMDVSDAEMIFELNSYPYKSALLEQYKERSGYACVYKVSSMNEYDSEEQLIACAVTDSGEVLPNEFVFKLLEVDCVEVFERNLAGYDSQFKDIYNKQLSDYKAHIDDRTNEFVDYEINKYEMWAEDQLVPLRNEVINLSRENESLRGQIRKEHNASAKLQLKKDQNQKAKVLSQKRAKLMSMEDEYQDKVDTMINKLEASMENKISSQVLFRMKWTIE
jgi:hypothetical protein